MDWGAPRYLRRTRRRAGPRSWIYWKGFDKFWTNLSRDLLPHTQAGEATVEYDSANGDLVANYRLGEGVDEPKEIPAIYVIGSDGFKKQMDVIKVGAGVYRGRLQIGSRQGLFRVRPLVDTPAFPEVGLYRPEVELTEYGSNQTLAKTSSRVHGRAVRAGSQSSIRRGRAHAGIHAATVAGTAGVGDRSRIWPSW